MPISGKQFDNDSDYTTGINARMYDFLKKNTDNAYTFGEVVEGVGIAEKVNLKTLAYQFMLESMVIEGVLDKKIIGMNSYYRAI
ncbi:MAG: hypothetical protein ACOWWO_05365 [Peptococcaceae bacterium]